MARSLRGPEPCEHTRACACLPCNALSLATLAHLHLFVLCLVSMPFVFASVRFDSTNSGGRLCPGVWLGGLSASASGLKRVPAEIKGSVFPGLSSNTYVMCDAMLKAPEIVSALNISAT